MTTDNAGDGGKRSKDGDLGTGVALGLAFGAAFGLTVFDNLALGVGVGLALGVSFGSFRRNRQDPPGGSDGERS